MASCTTATVLPEKAGRPAAISYKTAPNENRSLRASNASPRACSGDIYAIVPTATPAVVSCAFVHVSDESLEMGGC
jgi:hypothetical protein